MNKQDTKDLAEIMQNLNAAVSDIDNGRFEIYATPQKRGPYATFVMEDKAWHETDGFIMRWYTLKDKGGRIVYPFEVVRKINDLIVERRMK